MGTNVHSATPSHGSTQPSMLSWSDSLESLKLNYSAAATYRALIPTVRYCTLLAGPSRKSRTSGMGNARRRTKTGGWRIFPLTTGCDLRHALPMPKFDLARVFSHLLKNIGNGL